MNSLSSKKDYQPSPLFPVPSIIIALFSFVSESIAENNALKENDGILMNEIALLKLLLDKELSQQLVNEESQKLVNP